MKNILEKPRILVVDDEKIIRQLFQRALKEKDYNVQTAETGTEALRKVNKSFFNLLIIDLQMPGINGISVLKEIKKKNPYIAAIIITGYPTIELAVETTKIGAFDFVCKPFDMAEIQLTIDRCLKRQKTDISHIRLSELMILSKIGKMISAPFDLNPLLNRIVDSALEITKATKGLLLLPDEKTKELSVKVARGLNKEIGSKSWIDSNEKILSGALQEIEPIVAGGIDEGSSFREKGYYSWKDKSLLGASSISAFLYFQGDVLGVVGVADKISGEDFTEREKTILSVLAVHATTAIENTKLYNQLEKRVDILKQTVKQLNETQSQLIQTEKMASMGRLAFGIAHEIRNPLAIILQGVEFIKINLSKEDKLVSRSIRKIKRCVDRANNIIVELLKFSKTSELKLQPASICELLDSTMALIKEQAALKNIEIIRNFPQKDIPIKVDYNILRQAFFNLGINAIEAMPKGGVLYLDVKLEKKGRIDDEGKIIIKIKDTGLGIAKNKISKIFDPFFTMKEPGEGVGLGLSIVHLILERHKASIEVESQIGKGTVFTIELPRNKEGLKI